MSDNIAFVNGVPDVVSVQKRAYPFIATQLVSVQPTQRPIATAFGFKQISNNTDDGSGWSQVDFRLDRWYSAVETNKLKTQVSVEVVQDLQSMGISPAIITDNISDKIASDINQDLFKKLNDISTVGGAADVSSLTNDFDKGRELYSKIHSAASNLERVTGFVGKYILASSEVYGLMLGTGMVKQHIENHVGICDSGLFIIHDKYSSASDYFTVGVKATYGDIELSSLVFSPYEVDGSSLSYEQIATDPNTLSPVFGVMSRYAVTTAPLAVNAQTEGANEIDWDNITDLQKSLLSTTHAVTL